MSLAPTDAAVIAAVTQLGGLIPELPQAPEIQDMYFLGFPYGELFSDLKVEKVVSTSRFPLSKNMKVAGVVSGYTPDLQFVLEPKKITQAKTYTKWSRGELSKLREKSSGSKIQNRWSTPTRA